MAEKFKLSEEDAEKVRKANLTNILKKAKAGKTLTPSELRIVDGHSAARVYESLDQCAAATGMSKHELKTAKKLGGVAAGFRGSRVDFTKLQAWLKSHEGELESDDKNALECRRLRIQCERAEHALSVDRGEFIPKAEVDTWLTGTMERFKMTMMQRFVVELPPKLQGRPVPEMADAMEKAVGECIGELRGMG